MHGAVIHTCLGMHFMVPHCNETNVAMGDFFNVSKKWLVASLRRTFAKRCC